MDVTMDGHDVLIGRRPESAYLSRLLADAREGRGRCAVVSGEPGIGKTVLLDHFCRLAGDALVLRTAGTQAEQGFAYAALHHLLGAFLDHAGALADLQRAALRIAFGLQAGEPSDEAVVSDCTLALLRVLSADSPVICVVDDQQWLDAASTRVLRQVGDQLGQEKVALLFAATVPSPALDALPRLHVPRLSAAHADELLDAVLIRPSDPAVRRQIVAEADGNPSVMLQMAAAIGPFGLADEYAAPAATAQAQQVETGYRARLTRLPDRSRRLVQLAAVDPVGEPERLWAAAAVLGLDHGCLAPAVQEGLINVGRTVHFVHPLARSAAFRAGSPAERRAAHAALAAVTDPQTEPDRRAWHRAQAADGPDEALARDLDRFAGLARRRGGLAAAAAFARKAAALTPDKQDQAVRLISAAEAARDSGALAAALDLLELVDESVVDERQIPRLLRLRGQVALAQQQLAAGIRDLLGSAGKLAAYDPGQAREVCLEALVGAIWSAEPEQGSEVVEATRAIAPTPFQTNDTVALLLNGLRTLVVEGYALAAPALRQAVETLISDPDAESRSLPTFHATLMLPLALWHESAWPLLIDKVVAHARDDGALRLLACSLDCLAVRLMWTGDLAAAGTAAEQARRLHATITGAASLPHRSLLAAWQGDEVKALKLAADVRSAPDQTARAHIELADYAEAVVCNGTGRFEQAHAAARRVFDADGPTWSALIAPELADSASRCGAVEDLRRLEAWLAVRVEATPGPWVVGIAERVRALLSPGDEAERHYQGSIDQLRQTASQTELARSELLYGEWLRRQGHRGRARTLLREAQQRFSTIGAGAFAERAARELRATGGALVTGTEPGRLTPQEAQIAALAGEGLTNPEIGARLFISSRTVQHHLRHVFQKLGITSRAQLKPPRDSPEVSRSDIR